MTDSANGWLEQARYFAMIAHGTQKYGELPYIVHLEDVRKVLIRFGHTSQDLMVAAILHDVIEDTAKNYSDVLREFGQSVAELVYAVTDELGRNRRERHAKTYPKIAHFHGGEAIALKLADRIANVEHSIDSKNKRMLHLYWEEHSEFYEALSKNYRETFGNMWAHLNELVQTDGETL